MELFHKTSRQKNQQQARNPELCPMITLTTPALLFPAISLLLLAYTNRFLVIAQLIRSLSGSINDENRHTVRRQISSLRERLRLIVVMQLFGVVSFLLCTLSMMLIFLEQPRWGSWLFGVSILALGLSLLYSLWEISISTRALNVILDDLDQREQNPPPSHPVT
jgi:uncharacterized membrane protein